jgi:sugar lactone lactonase YvrE
MILSDKWKILADDQNLCGEGPLWDIAQGVLYWTDAVGHRFYGFDPRLQQVTALLDGWEISGFALNQDRGFVVVNSAGIWLWDGSHSRTLLSHEVDGFQCHMNDCIADPCGRLLAGSQFYDSNRSDYPLGHLMRVDHDGSVHLLDDGIRLANGLGFSPDGRTLYFADSAARTIFTYEYELTSGRARGKRIFVQTPIEDGLPDGLTVDAEGFIWCAQWFGSSVIRYDPDGVVERRIPVPAKQVSSLAFGGPDLCDLFVTTAQLNDSLPLAPPNYDPHSGNIGGQLFVGNFGIAGKEEFRCDIRPGPIECVVRS